MAGYLQQERLLAIDTPLGKDKLLLRSLYGEEAISKLFYFQLDLLSDDPSIPFKDIVGKAATVSIRNPDGKVRYIHGYISRFMQGSRDNRFSYYRAELVPWLWFLTRTADCRIFQNKTIPDVIQQIFKDLGFTDYKLQLQGSSQTWDYCVQYRETDYNFVARLMEQEGIFYYFEHDKGKHTLVMCNKPVVTKACPNVSKFQYEGSVGARDRHDVINSWEIGYDFRSGKYAVTDYNFTTPSTSLMSSANAVMETPNVSKFEIYDYPGEYDTTSEGEGVSQIRIEEEEGTYITAHGSSHAMSMIAGFTFDLKEHYRKDMNEKTFLLTHVHHAASVGDSYDTGIATETYENQFTCIPKSAPFRPPRITPKPIVQGVQTAVVVGPKGEEIYVDKYSRVKVQFHWDREGKKDENTTCWIRVSTPWAGKNWGFIQIPRIGQEVIVDFLEGDPDQPIIVGRVYNAEQMPPYELPANQTVSGVLTRSSKGATAKNANEIYIEDKVGGELFRIHAEKDFDISVEHDTKEYVNHDRSLIVKNDQMEEVRHDLHLHTKNNKNEKVDQVSSLEVGKDSKTKVGMNAHMEAGQNIVQKAGMNYHVTAMTNHHTKCNAAYAVEAGATVHIKAGATMVLEAGAAVTLKGPGGHVSINPVGVFIAGNIVFINSGGAPLSGAGSSPGSPASPTAPKAPERASDGSSGMEDK